MSDLKPKGTKIKLGNNEFGLRFTLNAIDDIEDHFDIAIEDIGELFKDKKNRIKNLKFVLSVLINEDVDCVKDETGKELPHVDERYVGRHINVQNAHEMTQKIFESVKAGTPEADDDDVPNAQSE